jgi:hypothetical protein
MREDDVEGSLSERKMGLASVQVWEEEEEEVEA